MESSHMQFFRAGVLMLCVMLAGASWSAGARADVGAVKNSQSASVQQPGGEVAPVRAASGYRLGPGDVITIRVYGEDDMTREKLRLPDSGMVSFPFGDVCTSGLTVSELETKVTDGLRGDYLVNPRVSVNIDEYRPFFIYGQVEKPGGYPFQAGLNVRKAVSIAGGFKERASLGKIFVVREGDAQNAANKVDLSSPIGPGDTVTVEESFF